MLPSIPRFVSLLLFGCLVAAIAAASSGTQHSRRTAIVEAVESTRESIVVIRNVVQGYSGKKTVYASGVIFDQRGFVVTNAHVVGSANQLAVILWDGTQTVGQVHAVERQSDLAIIRLPSDRAYKELALASSEDLMVGESVIAVGNPFGYTNTVSSGIISALNREIPMGETKLTNVIQTNADINPGNSGGPLLNINGELIGITVAVREGAQGIAFALDSSHVSKTLDRLMAGN